MNTQDQANRLANIVGAARVPGQFQRQIAQDALQSQVAKAWEVMYSRVYLASDANLAFQPQTVHAFGYQIGQSVDGSDRRATEADTNLTKDRRTNDSRDFLVEAFSLSFDPASDMGIIANIDPATSVELRLNNKTKMWLGNPSDIPGGSTLAPGATWLNAPALDKTEPAIYMPATNGKGAVRTDILLLPEPIIWKGEGVDSILDVEISVKRAISIDSEGDRTKESSDLYAGGTVITQTTQFNSPYNNGEGVFESYLLGLKVRLYGHTIGARSVNQ